MKYFITGATGFIGSHLVNSLISQGHEVNALCRSRTKASRLHAKTDLFIGDILDVAAIRAGMKDCDYVLHLAAYANVWAKDSGHFYRINVEATNRVLEAARDLGVRRIVVVSTAGVYGASFGEMIDEGFVRKKDFFNEYEGSKALSESHIKDFVIQGLDIVIVSPTRVYGPYLLDEPDSVSLLINKYVKGSWRFYPGPKKRVGNYVFVGDVVSGIQLALEKGQKGRTYILGGENYSYFDFFRILAEVSGKKRRMLGIPLGLSYTFAWIELMMAKLFGRSPLLTPKWIVKAKYDWVVSSARAEAELGYTITGLEEGFIKTLEKI